MSMSEIDLTQPFNRVLTAALSLPHDSATARDDRTTDEGEFKQFVRGVYEAANGRQVNTPIGFVAIAPPVAALLKAKPFRVANRIDLFAAVAMRMIVDPEQCESAVNNAEVLAPNDRSQSAQNDSAVPAGRNRPPDVSPIIQSHTSARLVS